MEITVVSAQNLKKPSFFSHHLKPFITLTTTPPSSDRTHVYRTTVDHDGGVNPTWGDKFDLSDAIDGSFFYRKDSYVYLEVYSDRGFWGRKFLGWCGIPATDIADGLAPAGTVRQLSYRVRRKDGSRGDGVVNVVVKLESSVFQAVDSGVRRLGEMEFGRVAVGIPVRSLQGGL